MKNSKKRVERLEKILKPVKRLQESRKSRDDSSAGSKLSFEERWKLREALETLEIRARIRLEEDERNGIPESPLTEDERKRILKEGFEEAIRKAEERQKDKKI